jgi:hypothetical protein
LVGRKILYARKKMKATCTRGWALSPQDPK